MHGRGDVHLQSFIGQPEGNEQLGRPWYIWKYNIKTDLKEIG